jgi:hypothetical protein
MESIPFRCEVTLRWYQRASGFDWELRHLGYGESLASIWESEDGEDDTDKPYAWATFCVDRYPSAGAETSGGADTIEEAKQAILDAMGIKVLTTSDSVV